MLESGKLSQVAKKGCGVERSRLDRRDRKKRDRIYVVLFIRNKTLNLQDNIVLHVN